MLEDVNRNRPEMVWLYEGLRIVLPTTTFDDRYALDGVEVINTGGHSDCSSIVHVPEDGALFAGDLVVPKMFPWAGDPTADPDAWIGAFKRILELGADTIVPGHGPPCDSEEIRTQLAYFETTRVTMANLIADGASKEEVVNYDGYPEFYESPGGEKAHYLRAWYRVLSNES